VVAEDATIDELLHDLDRRFPGLRFRVVEVVTLVQALSGG
jgi:hypothetical protein